MLCLLLPSLVAGAGPTNRARTGTLAGTVLDARGEPAGQATITLQTSDGQHPRSATADAQGRFSFSQLAPGSYDLRAYHDGAWSEWKHNLSVRTGKKADVLLRLVAPRKSKAAQ